MSKQHQDGWWMGAAVGSWMQGSCVEFIFRLMGVCTSLLSMRHWFYHYHSRQSIQIRANFVVLCDVRDTSKLNCMLLSTGKIMTVPCVRQRPETAGGSSAVPQQPLRSPRQQPALHFEHVSADPSWFLSQDDLKFNPGVVFCYTREKWLWRGKQSTVWHRAIFFF